LVFLIINKYRYFLLGIIVLSLAFLVMYSKNRPSTKQNQIKGKICLIIDDFGNSENDLHRDFLTLSNDITISIIPGQSYSEDIAHMAYKYGFEIMVHMPMEAFNFHDNNIDKYILTENLSFEQVKKRLENAFIELPNAGGMNNHQGSKATENIQLMKNVARSLKTMDKYFIDSYTSVNSKAFITMRQNGVKTEIRQIFLDNIEHPDSIMKNLDKLIELSHSMDVAIGIGHVKEETYKILKEQIPILKADGYHFLNVSEIVR